MPLLSHVSSLRASSFKKPAFDIPQKSKPNSKAVSFTIWVSCSIFNDEAFVAAAKILYSPAASFMINSFINDLFEAGISFVAAFAFNIKSKQHGGIPVFIVYPGKAAE